MPAVDVVQSLTRIGEDDLSRLSAGRSFYVSGPWLRAVERLRTPDVVYITHRDSGGRLDGLLPLYRQRPGATGPYDTFGRYLRRAGGFVAADWSPSLLLGQSSAYSNEFLVDPAATPRVAADILQDMFRAADEQRRAWGLPAVAALYLNRTGARQLDGVESLTASLSCDVECEVDIEWDSWDGYVQYLHALRGRRSMTARRETRAFHTAGYEISVARLSEMLDTANVLFTQLQQKYGDNTSMAERARYLRILADELDDCSRLFVMRSAGTVVGACLTFLWGDTLYARQLGLDYERLVGAAEYFNLAIYEPIRHAIEHSYKRVHFGRSAYDAKMFRGAKARPLLGACWSATVGSPDAHPAFQEWNRPRLSAGESGDRSLIMTTFGTSSTSH